MPPGELAHRLTERQFARLYQDAAHRLLPQRRLELLLANIARLIDARMGGAENTRLADYLFDPVPDAEEGAEPEPAPDPQAVADLFGFSPRNRLKKTRDTTDGE